MISLNDVYGDSTSIFNNENKFDNPVDEGTGNHSLSILTRIRELASINKPIWNLEVEGKLIKLKKPVTFYIHKKGNSYFAENETLNVYGIGQSLIEAIDQAKQHISYFYSYYKTLDQEKVIGQGEELKNIYRELV